MSDPKDVQLTSGKRNDMTVVAEDKNWRTFVSKELNQANQWSSNWGFLAGGAIEEGKEPEVKSKGQQIEELQEKMN
tara:strand:- start:264 stop:491 length:228 start_codon:yes stop_codon:yes gene_type:complete